MVEWAVWFLIQPLIRAAKQTKCLVVVLLMKVKDELIRSGKADYDTPRGMLKFEEVDAAGQRLAAQLVDPAMSVDKMKSMLRGYENIMDGVRNLDDVGYAGTFRAIKGLMDDYYNMDSLKASACLQTSMAGRVMTWQKVLA